MGRYQLSKYYSRACIIIEEMMDRNLEKLKYETSVHHKQNLRSQIDQNLIDKIEISATPSLNYLRAYQSLYHDELQKSVMLHDRKKELEQTRKDYDKMVSNKHQQIYQLSQHQPFKESTSAINISNLNYKDVGYLNYDLLKQTKALDHTLKNYDGGEKFYTNCDRHLAKQTHERQNMRVTLMMQLNQKQEQRMMDKMKKEEQSKAIRVGQNKNRNCQSQVQMGQLTEKVKHRNEILSQIQEERIKRGRRSIFNYDTFARHNPITNPIEYHIDNPYILKHIQNSNRLQ